MAKLDAELVDSIRLAIIMLTSASAKVHDIFCALAVGNVTLLRLSSQAWSVLSFRYFRRVILGSVVYLSTGFSVVPSRAQIHHCSISKVNELATKPPEFASTWLHNESTLFRLFCRVELGQKPVDATESVATAKGLPLLHLFLKETLALPTPVPLCSVFVVSEILQVAFED